MSPDPVSRTRTQDVNATKRLHCQLHRRVHLLLEANVTRDRKRSTTRRLDLLGRYGYGSHSQHEPADSLPVKRMASAPVEKTAACNRQCMQDSSA
jgi:hypothetical protein